MQHLAASEGHKSTVRLLLAASAHVNVTDRFGGNRLPACNSRPQSHPFRLGIQNVTRHAGTPLMDATREGHLEIAQMLRDAGASEAALSGESAPRHQVSLCRATRYLKRGPISCFIL